MRRVTGVILFAVLALTFAPSAQGQPAPRRLAFAEVATATLQNNLQLRVAMLDVAVAEAQLAVFSAEQTYLQILLAQENVTAARRTLAQAEESLRVARARVQAGAAPEFDVLQADVAVAGARAGRRRARAA